MIESNDPGRPDLCKELVAPAFDVAWHVAIANHLVPKYTLFVPELKPFLDTLFEVITPFAHAAMVVTIAVFVRMGYRTKRVPPLSALVPIPLLYFGYLVFTGGYAAALLLVGS